MATDTVKVEGLDKLTARTSDRRERIAAAVLAAALAGQNDNNDGGYFNYLARLRGDPDEFNLQVDPLCQASVMVADRMIEALKQHPVTRPSAQQAAAAAPLPGPEGAVLPGTARAYGRRDLGPGPPSE